MELKSWHKRLILSVVALGVTSAILLNNKAQIRPIKTDETESHRAKWATHGSASYSITVFFSWLPDRPRARALVFRDNVYVSQGPDPDCKLPADWCALPLSAPESYGIDNLFREAAKCTDETKAAYVRCQLIAPTAFHGFESVGDLVRFGQACGPNLRPDTTFLCAVEYEPKYGYPRKITWFEPNAIDSIGGYETTKFQSGNIP
jgi:hypothetical protein